MDRFQEQRKLELEVGQENQHKEEKKPSTSSHRETIDNISRGFHFSAILSDNSAFFQITVIFFKFNYVIFIYYCFYFSPKLKNITKSFFLVISCLILPELFFLPRTKFRDPETPLQGKKAEVHHELQEFHPLMVSCFHSFHQPQSFQNFYVEMSFLQVVIVRIQRSYKSYRVYKVNI